MRYLKTYEAIKFPSKGDYVLTQPNSKGWTKNPAMVEFHNKTFKNRIGKVRDVKVIKWKTKYNEPIREFYIWFEGISDSWYMFLLEDIVQWSKTEGPLEKTLTQNRFDL